MAQTLLEMAKDLTRSLLERTGCEFYVAQKRLKLMSVYAISFMA